MTPNFTRFIETSKLWRPGQKILVAVSGGIDSMVLVHLMKESGQEFSIGHCHFGLRGEDSDLDEMLVKETAHRLKVPYYHVRFDTLKHAADHKCSVQMAARALRYNWLEQIRESKGLDWIATGHHLDDAIETFFINMLRGAGPGGLRGMPVKNGNIVRPLLFARRTDIEAYAKQHQLPFREDASNDSDKYLRNRIRHHLIPVLGSIHEGYAHSMQQMFRFNNDFFQLSLYHLKQIKNTCVKEHEGEWHINIKALTELPQAGAFLAWFLRPFGFGLAMAYEVAAKPGRQAGKRFYSESHMLITDREYLILAPIARHTPSGEWLLPATDGQYVTGRLSMLTETISASDIHTLKLSAEESTRRCYFDKDRLVFPLIVRYWKNGDRMAPLGMQGSKKISDLLTDSKVPSHQKKEVMVVESQGRILWVAGIRSGRQARVTKNTRTIFSISVSSTV